MTVRPRRLRAGRIGSRSPRRRLRTDADGLVTPTPISGWGQPGFFQVEVVLDPPQGGDPDPTLVAQIAQRAALEGDEVAAQGQVRLGGGGHLVLESFLGRRLQPVQPGEVLRPQAVGELLGQLRGPRGLSEVIEHGLGELQAGPAFGIGDGGMLAQPQAADQRGSVMPCATSVTMMTANPR